MVNVGALVGGTVLACALKLTTSVDDLIWFSPFLALCKDNTERFKCCVIYAIVCLIVTFGALTVAYLADMGFSALLGAAGNDGEGYWDSARILSLVAAVAIGAYAGKEYREWAEEDENRLPTLKEMMAAGTSAVAKIWKPASTYKPVGKDEDDSVGSSTPRRGQKNGSADSAEGLELETLDDDEEEDEFAGAALAVSVGGVQLMPSDDVNDFNEEATAAAPASPNGDLPSPFREIDEKTADVDNVEKGLAVPGLQNVSTTDEDEEEGEEELDEDELEAQKTIEEARKSSTRLFVVAFCGTLDDMTMFAAVILGKSILYVSLVVGSMLATVIIIVACWQISLYKPFAECIQKVPMWCLLSALSLYILIGGLAR